jgi:tetratricopeptide (TPR) repeat protein/predicted Ser/Thr protein kinase
MEEAPPTLDADETLASAGGPTPVKASPRLEPGTQVGRYTISGEIGSGAMGVVYSAHDPELDRGVALKIVDRLSSRRSKDREAFFTEARSLAKLSSPYVVAVFDVGRFGEGLFIAMEQIAGNTLEDWLAEGKRDRSAIIDIYVQAGRGLADAHAAGIVHGDFKPHNVMVDETGRARVLDFGLARPAQDATQSSQEPLKDARPRGGTPAYMAPELFAGESGEAAADQFGFCVALWEGLVGERPFPGSSVPAIVTSIAMGRIRPIPSSARVPRWLQAALRRGLSARPEDRWPSMQALLRELTRPRRGITTGLVAIAVLGVSATAFAFGTQQDERAECERAIEGRLDFWDDERAASVQEALLKTALPYAERVAERVDTTADAYVEKWRVAAVDVCTTPETERPPKLRAAAQACLEDRRMQFDALATLMLKVTKEDLPLVSGTIDGLPSVEDCTHDVKLAAETQGEPDDASTAKQVASAQAQLSRVWALGRLGHYPEAAALAANVTKEADAMGFVPLRFEAHLALGEQQVDLEQPDQAESHLRRAYELAVEMGNPKAQMDAALSLGFHFARLAEVEPGRGWIFIAQALLVRPEIEDQTRARFHLIAAELDQADRRLEDAIVHQLRAHDILRRTEGEASIRYATQSLRLSHLLRKTDKLEEALELQVSAGKVLRAAFGVDHPHVADATNAQALTLLDLGRPDEAAALFEEALRIWRRTLPADNSSVAFALVNLSRVRADVGEYAEALEFCEEALSVRERTLGVEHLHTSYTRADRAELLRRLGRAEEARVEAALAVEMVERKLGADHPNSADPRTVLGRSLSDLGRHDEAVPVLRRAMLARQAAEYEYIRGENATTQAALALALAASPEHEAEALAVGVSAREEFAATEKSPNGTLARDEAELRAWLRRRGVP